MSRADATITVFCDYNDCDNSIDIELCPLAMSGSWDERYVNNKLEEEGWESHSEIEDYCPDCLEDLAGPKRWCKECGLLELDHINGNVEGHEFIDDELGE